MDQRALPTVLLHETLFCVDVDSNRLFEKDKGENVIEISYLRNEKGRYFLDFDLDHKCEAGVFSDHIIPVSFPDLVKLDPEGIALKYGVPLSELPESDDQLKCRPDKLTERVMGRLPRMSIVGKEYFIDLRLDLLRPVDDFRVMGIKISELTPNESGTAYLLFVNKRTKLPAGLPENLIAIPKNIIPVEIPREQVLDSFAYAISLNDMNGLSRKYPIGKEEDALAIDWKKTDMNDLFNRFPIRDNIQARIIPWQRAGIDKIIKANLERNKKTAKGIRRAV